MSVEESGGYLCFEVVTVHLERISGLPRLGNGLGIKYILIQEKSLNFNHGSGNIHQEFRRKVGLEVIFQVTVISTLSVVNERKGWL